MKVVLPVESNSMQTEICQSFGRAPYFLIYDTNINSGEFISNEAVASPGGAGIKAAQTIVDSKAEAVVVPRLGEKAANVLNAAGIKLYKSISANIVENVNLLMAGNLAILDSIHPGFHGR